MQDRLDIHRNCTDGDFNALKIETAPKIKTRLRTSDTRFFNPSLNHSKLEERFPLSRRLKVPPFEFQEYANTLWQG